MASFNKFSALVKAIEKDKGVKKDAMNHVDHLGSRALNKYANELNKLIRKNAIAYYRSYQPKWYWREYALYGMFEDRKIYDKAAQTVQLVFKDKVYQWNAYNDHKSFVPGLINYGWKLKNAKTKNRFTYFEGSFFITNAIDEFNALYASEGVHAMMVDV